MSRRIARGACCAIIALLVLPAAAVAAFGERTLRAGMYGQEVRVLQVLLGKAGFRTAVDGAFGPGTAGAVRRWEGARGRPVDGRGRPRGRAGAAGRGAAAAVGGEEAPQPEAQVRSSRPMILGARRRPAVTAAVPAPGPVTAEVLDEDGAVVTSFTRTAREAGELRLRWNGRDGRRPAPEGTYSLRLAPAAPGAVASAAASQAPEFEFRHHRFPIRGPHDLGQSETNSFGGGRGHQGQDMFARCGTPVVAAQGGLVRFAGYHSAAGHYLVIRGTGSGEDYVYMHLRDAPSHRAGERVATGEQIGAVGQTGRATGCHLHFELWTKPGWYAGGHAYDPLPKLRRWDGWS